MSTEPNPSTTTRTYAVASAYGDPTATVSVLEGTLPPPGPGQVTVDVRAAGMNPIDVKTVRGAMGTDPATLPLPLGFEAAGVVSAIGSGVDDVAVGDEVIVYRAVGGYASALNADLSAIHPKPAELDFAHAAGLLLVGVTAADAVATAGVGAGDVVLVHGGSGAVGSIAVQLSVRAGATVLATGSPANQEFIAGLGAIPIVYGPGLSERVVSAAPAPVTASIDTVGTAEAIDTSLALHGPARIVSIAAFGRAGDGITLVNGSTQESKSHRAQSVPVLIAAAADGSLVTEVAKTFPLAQAAPALTELAGSHPRGKFILIP